METPKELAEAACGMTLPELSLAELTEEIGGIAVHFATKVPETVEINDLIRYCEQLVRLDGAQETVLATKLAAKALAYAAQRAWGGGQTPRVSA